MAFRPDEILLSPTTNCNLICSHCDIKRSNATLSVKAAKRFLIDCKKNDINRVGFTGGEPFLAGIFLPSIIRFAVKEGFLFTRIITNGVWHKDGDSLRRVLKNIFDAGYDGSISVSVDAYHKQNLRKLVQFIKTAIFLWRRPDLVSIVYVTGRDSHTKEKLSKLAGLLGGRLSSFETSHPCIRSDKIFIKIARIELSPIGKAEKLKNPWDGSWFKDDFCKGPGNVFLIEPSGDIKPCCGYASELPELTIGNIKKGSVPEVLKNIRQNIIVYDIFNLGLSHIKDRLTKDGMIFPGKTSNNCFFCHYILTEVPRPVLLKSLGR